MNEARRISFEEFADHLDDVFDMVIHDDEPVYVESQSGELVEVKVVKPVAAKSREFTDEDDQAFLSSAGGWSDMDIDKFLKDIYESRRSSRPSVEL